MKITPSHNNLDQFSFESVNLVYLKFIVVYLNYVYKQITVNIDEIHNNIYNKGLSIKFMDNYK